MILQQYIQEVLFRQRVCVIPQLGTFTLQHFPAQYNVNTQTLTPPWDQVLFSQTYQDDGSCLEWIALKENLVPSVAQRKLEKYLEEMKEELRTGKPMELPGIGTLQGDFAGNIHFFAIKLPVSQASLDLHPIREQQPEETPVAPPPPAEPIEPIMTEQVENTLEAIEEEGGFKWWWAVIPVVVILAGVAAWWYITYQSKPVQPEVIKDTPVLPVAKPDSIATPPADTTVHAAPVDSTAAAAPIVAPTATDTLHYVAVYFTTKDSADAAKKQQRQKNWGREVMMYFKDGKYRLAVQINDADTAEAIKKVRKDFGTQAFLEKP
ncbi:hypothetical protein CLV59_103505 [Chitinophaga dinghuensis]|uniref:CCDC81-like prokaryotic HU domain-containing protein n=1 Tax=Chitinophaga dinghuensis TaxID=1539050 RepID=A0A327W2N5_9BACT|nr:hypothetical protein [Chitinophaga dinghuensis]RAJ83537.1 hypothetical protein CLV59_103505 [Chitinophaga dinghuensis]